MIYCRGCGKELHEEAHICPSCGCPQTVTKHQYRQCNKIVAALIALFFGGIGIHKFYLGRIGQGIVYLLFCWTFIPAFISFIEFIIYLCMNEDSFDEKYNYNP